MPANKAEVSSPLADRWMKNGKGVRSTSTKRMFHGEVRVGLEESTEL